MIKGGKKKRKERGRGCDVRRHQLPSCWNIPNRDLLTSKPDLIETSGDVPFPTILP